MQMELGPRAGKILARGNRAVETGDTAGQVRHDFYEAHDTESFHRYPADESLGGHCLPADPLEGHPL